MFTSFPAGGGGQARGRVLKSTGLRAGMPDILIFHDGYAYGLELKTGAVPLSPAQIATHEALRAAKIPVAVVRSLDEFRALLAGPWWPLQACIRETKPATERIRRGFEAGLKSPGLLDTWPPSASLKRIRKKASTA